MIRVYDEAGNVIQTHEHRRDFKEVGRSKKRPKTSQDTYALKTERSATQADAGGLACGFEPGRRRRRSHCYKQDWESFYSAFNNYDPDPEIPRYS